ncbi:MAG: YihY/virulence factor BrkB family protein [Lachnospiraceae bacterium]
MWRKIQIIRKFMQKCKRDHINAFAAQTAFFMLLSMIPALMLFSGLIRYTPVSEEMVANTVNAFMPSTIAPFVISILHEVYSRSVGILSVAGIAAMWSAAKGIQYLTDGLNIVNGIEEDRNYIVMRFSAVLDMILFLVVVITLLVVLVFGHSLQNILERHIPMLSSVTGFILKIRLFPLFILLFGFLVIIYTALPNRKATIKSQLPGALICTVALYVFTFALSVYVDYFHGFSMYGSLTTIMLIMLWLYFGMYIIFVCQEVNCFFAEEIEQFWQKHSFRLWKKR